MAVNMGSQENRFVRLGGRIPGTDSKSGELIQCPTSAMLVVGIFQILFE